MNAANALFLLHGYRSEYSLLGFAEDLRQRGLQCIEMTTGKAGELREVQESIQGKDVILVTSAHAFVDGYYCRKYAGLDLPEIYTSIELIAALKPKVTAFIPHDLSEPLISKERNILNQFDFFFAPYEGAFDIYSSLCRVIPAGWVKYRGSITGLKSTKKNSAVWLFGYVTQYHQRGFPYLAERIEPVLAQGVAVKFPDWPLSYEFESKLTQLGYEVIPCTRNSIDTILDYDAVITNGISSVVREAYYLGRQVYNLVESFLDIGSERRVFSDLGEVIFLDQTSDFSISQLSQDPRRDCRIKLMPFDSELVIETLMGAL